MADTMKVGSLAMRAVLKTIERGELAQRAAGNGSHPEIPARDYAAARELIHTACGRRVLREYVDGFHRYQLWEPIIDQGEAAQRHAGPAFAAAAEQLREMGIARITRNGLARFYTFTPAGKQVLAALGDVRIGGGL